MLNFYLYKNDISVYKMAKDINEPYSSINDIVNGKRDIDDCPVRVLKKISSYLCLSMEEVYKVCSLSFEIYAEAYDVKGIVYVKSKSYFLKFNYKEEKYDFRICKVLKNTTMFIEELAKYKMETIIKHKSLEEYLWNI